jgi:insulysin
MDLHRSKSDKREYKYGELKNGIKVLTVSDPTTETSACAIQVAVGSKDEPKEINGLAHFLEHMLFLGSGRYPIENHYDKFISEHGGYNNASTGQEATTYYFNISSDFLHQALDIFSRFFIDPLMDPSAVKREMNAVNAEFFKTLNDNNRKLWRLIYELMDDSFPVSKFSTGNLVTLDIPDIRDRVIEFHKQQYSANKMNIVVVGKDDVNKLFESVVNTFSEVKNTESKEVTTKMTALPYDGLMKRSGEQIPFIKIVPEGITKKLKLIWQMNSLQHLYKIKPVEFLCHVAGHEGAGSLLSYLKEKKLAQSLYATDYTTKMFTMFIIGIELTDEGSEKVQEVISIVFSFLDSLKTMTDEEKKRIYLELKTTGEISYNNASKQDPTNYADFLVRNMGQYAPEDILRGHDYLQDFNSDVLQKLDETYQTIMKVKPLIFHATKEYENKVKLMEIYNKTPYDIDTIDMPKICDIKECHIPEKNIFIPDDLTMLRSTVNDYPDWSGGKLFHCLETGFKAPKVVIHLELLLPFSSQNMRSQILKELYIDLLNDSLTEKLYDARSFQTIQIQDTITGIKVKLYGYNNKIDVTWKIILGSLKMFPIVVNKFNNCLERIKQSYNNMKTMDTREQASYEFIRINFKNNYHFSDACKFLERVTIEDVVNFRNDLFRSWNYIMLMEGNMILNTCFDFRDYLLRAMSFNDVETNLTRTLQDVYNPPEYKIYKYQPYNPKEVDINSCIKVYYAFPDEDFRDLKKKAVVYLFDQLISSIFYDRLRTRQQLGYVVKAYSYNNALYNKVRHGFVFEIQSHDYDCDYMREKIFEFVKHGEKELEKEAFQSVLDSYIKDLTEPFQTLYSQASSDIGEIMSEEYKFNRRNELLNIARQITFDDLIYFYRSMILENMNVMEIHIN